MYTDTCNSSSHTHTLVPAYIQEQAKLNGKKPDSETAPPTSEEPSTPTVDSASPPDSAPSDSAPKEENAAVDTSSNKGDDNSQPLPSPPPRDALVNGVTAEVTTNGVPVGGGTQPLKPIVHINKYGKKIQVPSVSIESLSDNNKTRYIS